MENGPGLWMRRQSSRSALPIAPDSAILAFVRALARLAAREDHKAAMNAGTHRHEESCDLRKVLDRPAKRALD